MKVKSNELENSTVESHVFQYGVAAPFLEVKYSCATRFTANEYHSLNLSHSV